MLKLVFSQVQRQELQDPGGRRCLHLHHHRRGFHQVEDQIFQLPLFCNSTLCFPQTWENPIFHVATLAGLLFTGFAFMFIWIIMDHTKNEKSIDFEQVLVPCLLTTFISGLP